MQKGYHYTLTAPQGRGFSPDFTPDLTPKQMLALGIFGGIYMRDCTKEFPKSWFLRAKFAKGATREKELNYFKVEASQPLSVWRKKGWLSKQDPRGWFQWYCRYYYGRRLEEEDARQIRRWRAMQRHVAQVKKHCKKKDVACRPKQRQALLHWAIDARAL